MILLFWTLKTFQLNAIQVKAMDTKRLLKAGAHGAAGGLAGFMSGLGIQAVATASGVGVVGGIPVTAILPVFTVLSIVLGFASGFLEEKK